jgi:Phage integrase family
MGGFGDGEPLGQRPQEFSEWRDAMTGWTKRSVGYVPKVTEVTLDQMKTLLSSSCKKVTKVLGLVAWLHAARVGNVLDLRVQDLELLPAPEGQPTRWLITWNHAKTTAQVGPYTTHSALSPEWERLLRDWLRDRRPQDLLIPHSHGQLAIDELRRLLRTNDAKHDLRSLRRGSLCAMARKGISMETLLVFSGHRTVDMLLRYIRRGRASLERTEKGAKAAAVSLL